MLQREEMNRACDMSDSSIAHILLAFSNNRYAQ
jgi:hypothetical protein